MSMYPGSITLPQIPEAPTFPPAEGKYFFYLRNDAIRYMNSDGIEFTLEEGKAWIEEIITITENMFLKKEFSLKAVPADGAAISLVPVDGPTQVYEVDYTLTCKNKISWKNRGLDGLLEVGDKLIIYYQRGGC